jgi:hypothetical protein
LFNAEMNFKILRRAGGGAGASAAALARRPSAVFRTHQQ